MAGTAPQLTESSEVGISADAAILLSAIFTATERNPGTSHRIDHYSVLLQRGSGNVEVNGRTYSAGQTIDNLSPADFATAVFLAGSTPGGNVISVVPYDDLGNTAYGETIITVSGPSAPSQETVPSDHTAPVAEPQAQSFTVFVDGGAFLQGFLTTTDRNTANYTSSQLAYTIIGKSSHGYLLKGGAIVSSFTQYDVDNNLVQYLEDGSTVASDSFTYTISDPNGGTSTPATFTITIQPPVTVGQPQQTADSSLAVGQGLSALITDSNLYVTDNGLQPWKIIYRINDGPTNGQVLADGINSVTSFTQQEIDLGLISYHNNGNIGGVDSFAFTVSDTTGASLGQRAFNINVTPANNLHTTSIRPLYTNPSGGYILHMSSEGGYAFSDQPSFSTFTLTPGNVSQLDSLNLSAVDPGVDPSTITYTFVGSSQPVLFEIGEFNTPIATNGATFTGRFFGSADFGQGYQDSHFQFTQADINAGRVFLDDPVRNPQYGSQLSVTFSVSDSVGNTVASLTLPVVLDPRGELVDGTYYPFSQIPEPQISVPIGGTVTIGPGMLTGISPQFPTEQIGWTLAGLPAHGSILLNGTPLGLNGTFTQSDIDQGHIAYEEDGSVVPNLLSSSSGADFGGDDFLLQLTDPNFPSGDGGVIHVFVKMTGTGGGELLAGAPGAETLEAGAGNSYFVGDGSTTVSYEDSPNPISVDFSRGTVATGYGGTDTLQSVNSVIGSAYDDTFTVGSGSEKIDGGGGADTVIFPNARSQYTITPGTVTTVAAQGATDTLTNIRYVQFGQETIDLTLGVPGFSPSLVLTNATEATPLSGATVATLSDNNPSDTASALIATIDWGDGATSTGTIAGSNGSFTVAGSHIYDEEGSYSLSATITRTADNTQSILSGTVLVADGDSFTPQGLALTTAPGQTFSGTVATFSDSDLLTGAGDLTASIDWGDGTTSIGSVDGSGGSFSVAGNHDYSGTGQEAVAVTLTDDSPGTATAAANSTITVTPPASALFFDDFHRADSNSTGNGWTDTTVGVATNVSSAISNSREVMSSTSNGQPITYRTDLPQTSGLAIKGEFSSPYLSDGGFKVGINASNGYSTSGYYIALSGNGTVLIGDDGNGGETLAQAPFAFNTSDSFQFEWDISPAPQNWSYLYVWDANIGLKPATPTLSWTNGGFDFAPVTTGNRFYFTSGLQGRLQSVETLNTYFLEADPFSSQSSTPITPAPAASALFFDDFHRADSNSTGNGWTDTTVGIATNVSSAISGGREVMSLTSNGQPITYRTDLEQTSGIAIKGEISSPNFSLGGYKLGINASDGYLTSGYYIDLNGNGTVSIGDDGNGGETLTQTGFVFNNGDPFEFEWDITSRNWSSLYVWDANTSSKPGTPTVSWTNGGFDFTPVTTGNRFYFTTGFQGQSVGTLNTYFLEADPYSSQGSIPATPTPAASALFFDDFHRANSGSTGNGWTDTTVGIATNVSSAISSDREVMSSTSSGQPITYRTDLAQTSGLAIRGEFSSPFFSDGGLKLGLNASDGYSTSGYYIGFNGSSGTVSIGDDGNGGETLAQAPFAFNTRDSFEFEWDITPAPQNWSYLYVWDANTGSKPTTPTLSWTNGGFDFIPVTTGNRFYFTSGLQGRLQSVETLNTYFLEADPFSSQTSVPCFCRGTMILTETGLVPVERLQVGDKMMTIAGEAKPITWIGHGRRLLTGKNPEARPLIVRADAIAPGVPLRDLHLTRGHSLYIDGALIPVEFLVNERSILWDVEATEVEFYHIELEDHDVLLAEGCPAESYRDDGNRGLFDNREPPRFAAANMAHFAPVLTGGPQVDRVWKQLLDRSGFTEPEATDDPDLHVIADGERVDPVAIDFPEHRYQGRYHFRLKSTPQNLAIVSRSTRPMAMGMNHDPRRLGVAIRSISLRNDGATIDLDFDSPWLEAGFNNPEPVSRQRWTTGYTPLPRNCHRLFQEPFELLLDVVCTARYLVDEERISIQCRVA